jgi:O-antigen/teichoic acid export membrane protein
MFKTGAAGLISGQITAHIFAVIRLYRSQITLKRLKETIDASTIKRMAIRYIKFPKYSVWGVLANTLSQHGLQILISTVYGTTVLGWYALVQRVLVMPSTLVGQAVGRVYFQSAKEEKQTRRCAERTFRSTLLRLVAVAFLFVPFYFVAEELFAFVFGEAWRKAGHYAEILTPFFAVRFVSSPLAVTLSLFERQEAGLVINTVLALISIGTIATAAWAHWDAERFLYLLSSVMTAAYAVFLFYYAKVVRLCR